MQNLKTRKLNRLKEYNYSQPGFYYVTICVNNRKCTFGDIIDNRMNLNNAGKMVDQILRTLPEHYQDITIDNYIVMPNHVHAIIIIREPVGAAPCGRPLLNTGLNNVSNDNNLSDNGQTQGQSNGPARGPAPTGLSLSDIIYRFKSLTTKRYIDSVKNEFWPQFDKHLWQRSFYDHVIRTNTSLQNIRKYIMDNPITWDKDENNPGHNNALHRTFSAASPLRKAADFCVRDRKNAKFKDQKIK